MLIIICFGFMLLIASLVEFAHCLTADAATAQCPLGEFRCSQLYLAPIGDSIGRALLASKTYEQRVPKNVPAREFWSLTMYDRRTWAFVNNPLDRAGLGSFNLKQMKVNTGGGADLYVGPKAPAGLESN